MSALTPISRKPMSLVLPTTGAAGGLLGMFVGTANGSGLLGIFIGALLVAGTAWVVTNKLDNERLSRWGVLALFAVLGLVLAGLPGLILGLLSGWFFGWFTFWLFEG